MWEYSSVKRRWNCFDKLTALQLQDAFISGSDGLKIKLAGADFLADFENNVIKSTDGIIEYKVQEL